MNDPNRRRAFVIKNNQRKKQIEPKQMDNSVYYTVIKIAHEIFDIMPSKTSEKHYQNAFKIGLSHYNVKFESERYIPVIYKDKLVTDLRMDLVIEDSLIVELKTVPEISDEHKNQLLRYMRISGIDNGVLINFGSSELQILSASGNPVEWV